MGIPNSWLVYTGKSQAKMDDDWGYPYDSGLLHLWCPLQPDHSDPLPLVGMASVCASSLRALWDSRPMVRCLGWCCDLSTRWRPQLADWECHKRYPTQSPFLRVVTIAIPNWNRFMALDLRLIIYYIADYISQYIPWNPTKSHYIASNP